MKRHLILLFIIVILSLTACNPTPIAISTPVSSATPPDNGLNLLVIARGPVQLKRDGWPGYQPTAFGAILRRGDILQPDPDAQATVLCADLTAWPLPASIPSGVANGCPPPSRPALTRAEGLIGPTKMPVDPLIPYVISPRKTRLMSGQPTLRWNSVFGVISYTVGIHGDDGSDWYTRTTDTQIAYPTDAPSLHSGITYQLLVKADNGRTSREEGAPNTGFRLLTPEEAEPIQADTARLQALALPPEAEAYALAHLYAGHNLIAEAVDLLETLVENGSQEAAVYRTLGDLYHRIGVERLAEEHYLKASELARQMGDVEGSAVALASLGEVYISLGNKDQALAYWQQALQQYQTIGDVAQTAYLQRRVDETK
jgi:hypothetical protein